MAEKIKLRLGHSPDPDDAFMFYGLATGKVDGGPYQFEHIMQDIQTLNTRAMKGELEITAISLHAFPYVYDKYALMNCGCSMGDGWGPMIVAKRHYSIGELKNIRIAVPGELTTSFMVASLLLGKGFKHEVKAFDEILPHVAAGGAEAGLIIHEGQLTYQNHGLVMCVDLAQWWAERTGMPLPLGGNVVRRDLGVPGMRELTHILRKSIQYSLDHRAEAVQYSMKYGRDLTPELADKFIGMYVNKWTLDYGQRGKDAVTALLDAGTNAGLIPPCTPVEFID